MPLIMKLKLVEHELCEQEHLCPVSAPAMRNVPCTGGRSGEYECRNVDMLSFVPLADLGCGGDANDIWGWTDPTTNHEYAMIGCMDGTSFVDVTDPLNPQVLGFLRTHTSSSMWRDLKVFNNHVFIVSEAYDHGMQVYDLRQLRDLKPSDPVQELTETAHYGEFGSAHNIVSNEATGYMYSVGSRTCTSGLHMVDVNDPTNPKFAGCFGEDGYVHDAQCVIYNGPDTRSCTINACTCFFSFIISLVCVKIKWFCCRYKSNEICFCYNEETLTIVDVTNKDEPKMLSREPYDAYYTHQGWLMEDQSHLLLNDELDELQSPNPHTRSLIWNVEDLTKPVLVGPFYSEKEATDHNLYLKYVVTYKAKISVKFHICF